MVSPPSSLFHGGQPFFPSFSASEWRTRPPELAFGTKYLCLPSFPTSVSIEAATDRGASRATVIPRTSHRQGGGLTAVGPNVDLLSPTVNVVAEAAVFFFAQNTRLSSPSLFTIDADLPDVDPSGTPQDCVVTEEPQFPRSTSLRRLTPSSSSSTVERVLGLIVGAAMRNQRVAMSITAPGSAVSEARDCVASSDIMADAVAVFPALTTSGSSTLRCSSSYHPLSVLSSGCSGTAASSLPAPSADDAPSSV
ncbi:unnamed protein product [Linum trigynum]|uniref:Uncharacterized protein n=1 Tax=Linum trigynum TaxID=586398 RepID=A0AAV2DUM7_9ROSI